MRENAARELLLEIADQGYERMTWHGPNLKQALRGVSARQAAWRPARGRHNIWEYTIHAAYWKYVARKRLLDDPRRAFPFPGRNWFSSPAALSEKDWKAARALLEREHRKWRVAVFKCAARRLRKKHTGLIFGVAFHDVYHAGQIQLLRRLQKTGY